MKLWIDALTPKQALFTRSLVQGAPSKFKCHVTTRCYPELDAFLKKFNLDATSLGRHGGKNREEKLKAGLERQIELYRFARENDFDCSLSFISPEASRVSFGLALRHYVCSDSPHAEAACRLAVPLAFKMFYPFPIKAQRWTRYGVARTSLLPYHALDPWAWISRSRKATASEPSVIIRLEEAFASYFKTGMGISEVLDRLIEAVPEKYEITIIPRYPEQRVWAEKKFGKKCIVPMTTVDGAALIAKASLVIGGGGTMTQEAALLGIPNISYFPSAKLDVFENFYFPRKLSERASSPQELLSKTQRIFRDLDREKSEFRARAQREVADFEDPIGFIFRQIKALGN